ncbi:MAG: hypothetical protein ABIW80_15670 [Lapillicoccus sp.]
MLEGIAELDGALSRAVAQMRAGAAPAHLTALTPDPNPNQLENTKAHA